MPIMFALFILVPLIEIGLFIQIGGLIGLWPTLALVVLSAVAGSILMRSQGMRTLAELQSSIRSFRDPTRPMAHGAMILFAGAMMLTPGFFTDVLGLALLVPWMRDRVMAQISKRMRVARGGFGYDSTAQPRHGWPGQRDDGAINADYEVIGDPPRRDDRDPQGPSGWTRPD